LLLNEYLLKTIESTTSKEVKSMTKGMRRVVKLIAKELENDNGIPVNVLHTFCGCRTGTAPEPYEEEK